MAEDDPVEGVTSFRRRLRKWLPAGLPRRSSVTTTRVGFFGFASAETDKDVKLVREQQQQMQRSLWDAGFAGILFPREYGGLGLSWEHQRAFNEEVNGYETPGLFAVTFGVIAPTILDFGSELQKTRHIPAMLRGDEVWVQYLSEPSNGSDLAGLLTRATRHEGGFVLNGTKTWTTFGHFADHALVLARSNWDLPKHQGLTMFILSVREQGVTVRRIRQANGDAEFCEEFLDDVVIPLEKVVGVEGLGWDVASRMIVHERNMAGGMSLDGGLSKLRGRKTSARDGIVEMVGKLGLRRDAAARQLVGEAIALDRLQTIIGDRIAQGVRLGKMPPPAAAMLRLFSGTSSFRCAEIAAELAGSTAVAWLPGDDLDDGLGESFVAARGVMIGGGTAEMARNTISERLLQLPKEPSIDRDVPFAEVRKNRDTRSAHNTG
jgi:alkylation response protein AidB-like acyl-CoA dehydrogenase